MTSKSLGIGDDLEFLYLLLAYTTTPDLWNVRNQAKDLAVEIREILVGIISQALAASTFT